MVRSILPLKPGQLRIRSVDTIPAKLKERIVLARGTTKNGFSGHFLRNFEIIIFCFAIAI